MKLAPHVGHGDELYEERSIQVRFIWSDITTASARWEQQFSDDGGASWESNWVMQFNRVDPW
jgi:hypothetical protein